MKKEHSKWNPYLPALFCSIVGVLILSAAISNMHSVPRGTEDQMSETVAQESVPQIDVATASETITNSVTSTMQTPPEKVAPQKPVSPAKATSVKLLPSENKLLPLPRGTKQLVTFSYPLATSILPGNSSTTISWKLSNPALSQDFPDFDLFFTLIDSRYHPGGVIMIAHQDMNSFTWDIAQMKQVFPSFYTAGTQYRIRARMEYVGKTPFTCPIIATSTPCVPHYPEPIQSRIDAAKDYGNDSDPFLIQ